MSRVESVMNAAYITASRKYTEIVDVRKSIIGSNVWFISNCPECDEKNTLYDTRSKPRNIKYECEWCGLKYRGAVTLTKVVVDKNQKHRKNLTKKQKKELCEKQHHRCYWCHRKFTTYIWDSKSHRMRELNPTYDHYKAFSFTFDNRVENHVASCPICNAFKHNMYFETENECRQVLEYKWNRALDKGRFEVHYLKG